MCPETRNEIQYGVQGILEAGMRQFIYIMRSQLAGHRELIHIMLFRKSIYSSQSKDLGNKERAQSRGDKGGTGLFFLIYFWVYLYL